MTNLLDPEAAPALELAALYHERWEIESVFDEFKTHLRSTSTVLRSKTPPLVEQELWGYCWRTSPSANSWSKPPGNKASTRTD